MAFLLLCPLIKLEGPGRAPMAACPSRMGGAVATFPQVHRGAVATFPVHRESGGPKIFF